MEDDSLPDDSDCCDGTPETSVANSLSHKRGRPSVNPKSDLTIGHMQHMLMGILVGENTKVGEVSKRTIIKVGCWLKAKGLRTTLRSVS